jgi:CO/xanthine dehydrogenase FAD-binding subunit
MIIEYHRPETIDDAVKLLQRPNLTTRPLGGGTVLSAPSAEQVAVVDLQALNLNEISQRGNALYVGASATLQKLLDSANLPAALAAAIRHEATYNMRHAATVAGSLVAADGRSAFGTVALALDAQLDVEPNGEKLGYGELLPLRAEKLRGRLITGVSFSTQPKLSYVYVARSPADLPIVAVALAQWPSGRTRLVLGGFGSTPTLAMDGKDPSGQEEALANSLSHAGDQWASAEYRLEAGQSLLKRAQAEIAG